MIYGREYFTKFTYKYSKLFESKTIGNKMYQDKKKA